MTEGCGRVWRQGACHGQAPAWQAGVLGGRRDRRIPIPPRTTTRGPAWPCRAPGTRGGPAPPLRRRCYAGPCPLTPRSPSRPATGGVSHVSCCCSYPCRAGRARLVSAPVGRGGLDKLVCKSMIGDGHLDGDVLGRAPHNPRVQPLSRLERFPRGAVRGRPREEARQGGWRRGRCSEAGPLSTRAGPCAF